VAYALDIQSSPDVVGTLIRLTRDTDARVRDWATFAFNNGHQERDSEEIREALLDRTDDEDAEARGEALIALARRHDARVADLIRRELEREPEGDWAIEAADLLADSSLVPDLEAARGRFPSTESIESVIVRLRATR
jgi:HEAT repeat protein